MQYLTSDEVKKVQLDLLIKFDEFCSEHELYYTLGGGSLLGAIRHKGFIPWDDDIDVMMPRNHYNKLMEIVSNEDNNNLDVIFPFDEKERMPFLKVVDKRVVFKSTEIKNESYIWMDVFPLDTLPESDDELRSLFKLCRKNRAKIIGMHTDLSSCKKDYKYIVKAIVKLYSKIVGWKYIITKADKDAQKYNGKTDKYIGCSLWGYGPGERMIRDEYMTPVKVEFEGHMFNAPSCWDGYLKGLYGDYMQLPPVEKRKNHSIKARRVD